LSSKKNISKYIKVLKSYLTGELHFRFFPDYLLHASLRIVSIWSRLDKTKDLDSPIKACPALDAGSGNDGSVYSAVSDYVIPRLVEDPDAVFGACRAVASGVGGTAESTFFLDFQKSGYSIDTAIKSRYDKSLRGIINFSFHPP
jgi:hypothetical protein